MMYIDKWWDEFIGGSDDSLTLLDYIKETVESEYSVGQILKDFHIKSSDIEYYRGSPSVYYTDSDAIDRDICYVINFIQDLAVLVLESYKNGNIKLSDLTKNEDNKVFTIICQNGELNFLIDILADFAEVPLSYEIAEMVGDDDMLEIARQCADITQELRAYM